jgi:hypothetical protein
MVLKVKGDSKTNFVNEGDPVRGELRPRASRAVTLVVV